MRTSVFLSSLVLTTLIAAACDEEPGLSELEADEPVAFRCGTPCLNSPYLGVYDITNQSYRHDVEADSPDGAYSMQWHTGTIGGATISSINVSVDGVATVATSTGATVPIVGARFDLEINDGAATTNGKIWFATGSSSAGDEAPSFNVTRYDIRTNIDPGPGHPAHVAHGETWYSVCPITPGGINNAVLLSHTHANANGSIGSVVSDSTEFVIACDGHALAKGVTELNVVPRSGHARSYGHARYSSLVQGWQAIFAGATRTYLGAKVGVVDTANSPPLFDTVGPIPLPPPVLGQYEWILESVYKDTGNVSRGARCKFTSHPLRPGGEHRNAVYDPPVANLAGWSSLPECSGNLSQFGDAAFYTISHMIYNGSGDPQS
ncbi:hypothetical protein [Nannocystis bainbridge]|uniref:Uncharacterized protein n=1 Tax=Nannocystis bainbridge TaxID=2995303 RepID=A0ABT5E8C0_9BACT|nr:hypothetical protein [Nannocystis bainbridge]MDC0721082.1 hypothetical protein [Nannocystis bainbridge]